MMWSIPVTLNQSNIFTKFESFLNTADAIISCFVHRALRVYKIFLCSFSHLSCITTLGGRQGRDYYPPYFDEEPDPSKCSVTCLRAHGKWVEEWELHSDPGSLPASSLLCLSHAVSSGWKATIQQIAILNVISFRKRFWFSHTFSWTWPSITEEVNSHCWESEIIKPEKPNLCLNFAQPLLCTAF